MSFESIVNGIEALPPLPESVQKIQLLFSSGDPDIQKLIKIIESDPILTANILAEANSPLYAFSKQIVSVTQAITLLGTAMIRSIVLSSAIKSNFTLDLEPYAITPKDLSNISNLQSMLMYQWYMGIDMEKSKILTPLAFLLEMGKIIIANEINQSEYSQHFLDEIHQKECVDTLETFYAEVTSIEINTLLFKHWNFDDEFIDIMNYMQHPTPGKEYLAEYANALKIVKTAINVHDQLSEESIENAIELASELGFDKERLSKVTHRIKQKLEL